VALTLLLRNWGTRDARDVEARLRCEDPFVTLMDSLVQFGDIPPGDSSFGFTDYRFVVEPGCPDGHPLTFEVHAVEGSRVEWDSDFQEISAAPAVAFLVEHLDDASGGNGNGVLEPGETAEIDVTLCNMGHADAESLFGILSEDDPYVELPEEAAEFSLVPAQGTGSSMTPFGIHVLPECPMEHYPEIYLALEGALGYTVSDTFQLSIGVSEYMWDMEDTTDWTHAIVTPGYHDEWHASSERSYSGSQSWKCGTVGGENGDSLDAGLLSPEFFLAPGSELRFRHWIDAEDYGAGECFDAGIVEIQTDDGPFETIHPDEAYPHWIMYNTGHPFPGQRGYSGYDPSWAEERFDLTGYHGPARIRFRFGAGHWYHEEGWYIDDVRVQLQAQPDIDLEPWEFCETLLPEVSSDHPLEIWNFGDEPLVFDVQVQADSAFLEGEDRTVPGTALRTGWLEVDPDSGIVATDSVFIVTVSLNASGLTGGAYLGSIMLSSNDPNEPWLLVPVELQVISGICGDANGSGIITPTDGYAVLNYLGAGPLPVSCWASNVNGDLVLTPADGFQLLNYIGSGPALECGPCDFGDRQSSGRGSRIRVSL
jgi:hypothetical protein